LKAKKPREIAAFLFAFPLVAWGLHPNPHGGKGN
jgi:hypothetical protein